MFHIIAEDKARAFIKSLLKVRSNEDNLEDSSDEEHSDSNDTDVEEEVDVDTRKVEDLKEKQDQFEAIFINLCALVKVLNSHKTPINVARFKTMSMETYKMITTDFPWCQVPESLHRILGHGWERIKDNGHMGLGRESEEGIEACTKCLRRDKGGRARTSTLMEHLTDVWNHR